jgi:hypothetical protein
MSHSLVREVSGAFPMLCASLAPGEWRQRHLPGRWGLLHGLPAGRTACGAPTL